MTEVLVGLNRIANACGEWFLAPIAHLPGWLSATLIAAGTGVLMLLAFKYTSRQQAIQRVRAGIKANLLALSLFKDNVGVSLRCQARIVGGATRLFALSIVPMVVMTVPMCLLLAQLAQWYQTRPLRVGEEAVLTVSVSDAENATRNIGLDPSPTIVVTAGPVRVPSRNMVCWRLRAETAGRRELTFRLGDATVQKQLVVGDGFQRVSARRPTGHWTDVLMYPAEEPFPAESPVQAVEISYPAREGWTSGADGWIVYWFVVSMVAAFLVRPWLHVHI